MFLEAMLVVHLHIGPWPLVKRGGSRIQSSGLFFKKIDLIVGYLQVQWLRRPMHSGIPAWGPMPV